LMRRTSAISRSLLNSWARLATGKQ
jgi:hypothetical protein